MRRRPPPRPATPRGEEARLLRLARDLSRLARDEPAVRALDAALERLAARSRAASRPEARRAVGRDKTRALALAWAREQARLALREVLEQAAGARAVRADLDRDALAWLLLAAGDALAREPADTASDRLAALRALLRPPGAG